LTGLASSTFGGRGQVARHAANLLEIAALAIPVEDVDPDRGRQVQTRGTLMVDFADERGGAGLARVGDFGEGGPERLLDGDAGAVAGDRDRPFGHV
jgi:hypothetical protein